jgi:8-oxo-dGTP pyrophosphatase MutT (NUDIX family)
MTHTREAVIRTTTPPTSHRPAAISPADDRLLEHVIRDVQARSPVDRREELSIERFLVEIGRLTEPLSEHAHPVHVTASGIVVGPRGVLLHRHRLLGIWVAPGGHIDAGETPWEAAVRETSEETGLTVTHCCDAPRLVHVDVHAGPRGHTHLDLSYLLNGGDGDPAPPPDESQEIAWFAWTDAAAVADHRMAGILRFLAARLP